MTSNDQYVVEILLENGLLTEAQVEKARESIVHGGTSVLDTLEERVPLQSIEQYGSTLLDDRRALGANLAENILS